MAIWRKLAGSATAFALLGAVVTTVSPATAQEEAEGFRRIATYSVYENNVDPSAETVAEIISVSRDHEILAYTDGEGGTVGFLDISDPASPAGLGTVAVGGEPTSVAFKHDYALVAVNTSASYTEPSGMLVVVSAPSGGQDARIVTEIPLAGQPDSIAVSPAGGYAAVVIENERDEDLGNGEPPQLPGGLMQVLRLGFNPLGWEATLRTYDFTGLPEQFGDDPEPEYVDINTRNQAVVSFQENNHVAVIKVWNGELVSSFDAGTVDLEQVDTVEDDMISLTGSLADVPREPDAVAWLPGNRIATANEGDLFGGSRGFSIFDRSGELLWDAGNEMEHLAVRHGHYPEGRSETRGTSPKPSSSGRSVDAIWSSSARSEAAS